MPSCECGAEVVPGEDWCAACLTGRPYPRYVVVEDQSGWNADPWVLDRVTGRLAQSSTADHIAEQLNLNRHAERVLQSFPAWRREGTAEEVALRKRIADQKIWMYEHSCCEIPATLDGYYRHYADHGPALSRHLIRLDRKNTRAIWLADQSALEIYEKELERYLTRKNAPLPRTAVSLAAWRL